MPPIPPAPPPPRLTHFLCIPLVTPASRPMLQSSLSTFRADVTQVPTTSQTPMVAIPELAIRPLGTLHLTLGVLSLPTQTRLDAAKDVLRSLNLRELLRSGAKPAAALAAATTRRGGSGSGISDDSGSRAGGVGVGVGVGVEGGSRAGIQAAGITASNGGGSGSSSSSSKPAASLNITLRGLESMGPAAKTSVLYAAPVDGDQRLRSFSLGVRGAFVAAGMLEQGTKPVLLHATIVNTVYVPGARGRGPGRGRGRAKMTIDAREVLERYEDFEWMKDVRMDRVAICRMGAQRGEDGSEEYVVEAEVEVP